MPEPGLARLAGPAPRAARPREGAGPHARRLGPRRLPGAFGVPPPRLCGDTPALVARLKRHPALYAGAAPPPAARRREPPRCGAPARARRPAPRPGLPRGRGPGGAAGDLPTTAIEEVVRHTRLPAGRRRPPRRSAGVDPDRRETLDGKPIDEDTPEARRAARSTRRTCRILLFLAALRGGAVGQKRGRTSSWTRPRTSRSSSSSCSGRTLAGHSVTLAGDEAQQTFSSYAGWPEALAALGVREARRPSGSRPPTAARAPSPTLAHAVLGPLAPARARRAPAATGVPVSPLRLPDRGPRPALPVRRGPRPARARAAARRWPWSRRAPDVRPRLPPAARRPARGAAGARRAVPVPSRRGRHRRGRGEGAGVRLRGGAGRVASRAYPDDDEARRRLHVAVTRAAHQLWIAAPGTPSPLLAASPAT